MENIEKLIAIPEKPADGFEIIYWYLSCSDVWVYIVEKQLKYYANTPWEVYSPEKKGGAPLIDDWVISYRSHKGHWIGEGRISGWTGILSHSKTYENWAKDVFPTREEAFQEAIKRYDACIQLAEERIAQMKKMQEELKCGRDSH